MVLLSILAIGIFGLNFGIDFTGGAVLKVEYEPNISAPSVEQARTVLNEAKVSPFSLQKSGENGLLIKTQDITEENHQKMISALGNLGQLNKSAEKFEGLGPSIGKELKQKTTSVTVLSLLAILIYVALAFRQISRPVKSYVYGITGL
ncbi:protein translocase subunit SecF, partial [Candidatus Gribaldobacteria bacterium]|nr:protein translocase subunit SecF [Candidatus Gribaldobacteria bacterium]